jgi:glycosyltransferase involved in cell wall biosynthesis
MPSSPVFSLALVGAILKRLHPRKVLLAIDMRDAWALHPELRGSVWLKRRIERWVLQSADRISTMSHDLAREMATAYGLPVKVYYNVATHYFEIPQARPLDWKALDARIDPARRKLVYTGSTPEGFYDVGALVAGVKQIRAARPHLADRLQLIFVGANDEVEKELARQGGGGEDFVFTSLVTHELAKAIQQNADGFLFFAFNRGANKGIVSTKFFEYLALGKPVLPISVCEGSDIDRLLMRFAGRSCRLNTAAEVATALSRFAEGDVGDLPRVEDTVALRTLADDYYRFARDVLADERKLVLAAREMMDAEQSCDPAISPREASEPRQELDK